MSLHEQIKYVYGFQLITFEAIVLFITSTVYIVGVIKRRSPIPALNNRLTSNATMLTMENINPIEDANSNTGSATIGNRSIPKLGKSTLNFSGLKITRLNKTKIFKQRVIVKFAKWFANC